MNTSPHAGGDAAPGASADGASGPAAGSWTRADGFAILVILAWLIFFWARIHIGFSLTDEGMYLAATDRLAHGDHPFRDDQDNPLRPFDVLMSWLWPGGGLSLVAARTLGIVLHGAQMVALWLLVRRFAGAGVAAVTALIPALPLFAIWTPGYNDLSCTGVVVAACCLALGTIDPRRARAMGIAGGVGLAIAWLSYLPTVALALVVLAVIAWGLAAGGPRHGAVRCGTALLGAAVILVALAALRLIAYFADWYAIVHDQVALQSIVLPLSTRIALCARYLERPLIDLIGIALALIGFRLILHLLARRAAPATRAWARWPVAAGPLLFLAWFLLRTRTALAHATDHGDWTGTAGWVVDLRWALWSAGLACILVFVAPAGLDGLRRGASGRPGGGATPVLITATLLIAYAAIQGIVSANLAVNMLHIQGAVAVLGCAGVAVVLRAAPPPLARPALAAGALATAVVAIITGIGGWRLVYGDAAPAACTAVFTHPPLSGVRSTPENVAAITTVQDWIDDHVPPDRRILAYHNLPGLYFATDRLPALDLSWTDARWAAYDPDGYDASAAHLLERMHRPGGAGEPAACVRLLQDDTRPAAEQPWPLAYRTDDPLHAWVRAHFVATLRHWPYEILVPRDAAHPWNGDDTIADAASPYPPPDPDVAIIPGPDTTVTRGADGAVTLDSPANGNPPYLVLVHYGDRAIDLRLGLACGPGVAVDLIRGTRHAPITTGWEDRITAGWDAVFPAAPAETRGFAVRPVDGGAHHLVLRHLTLHRIDPR